MPDQDWCPYCEELVDEECDDEWCPVELSMELSVDDETA